MTELILSAGGAILISGLCSVTEAVLYSVPWSYIQVLREEGKPTGTILFDLRADVEKPITAILTLNTIANTAGASIAGAAAATVFGSHILGLFAAIFTVCILLFSEIIPKTLGVAYCRTLAPFLARPVKYLTFIFTPVGWVSGSITRLLTPKNTSPHATEDDIRAIATLTRQSGEIQPYEEGVIRNILALDSKNVHDIMTPRTVIHSLSADMTVMEASNDPNFYHYSRIPVHSPDDSEDIQGIVYRRSVLMSLAEDRDCTTVGELMRPVEFVVESLSLDRLLHRFLEARVHLFVVLDEYGGLAGVVSLEDVMEEILGREIMDETDRVRDLRAFARRQGQQLTDRD